MTELRIYYLLSLNRVHNIPNQKSGEYKSESLYGFCLYSSDCWLKKTSPLDGPQKCGKIMRGWRIPPRVSSIVPFLGCKNLRNGWEFSEQKGTASIIYTYRPIIALDKDHWTLHALGLRAKHWRAICH